MDSPCHFCEYNNKFAFIIRKALYEKFSSSQNYTYIRIINDLVFARRGRITNTFKDFLYWDYNDEYLEDYFTFPQQLIEEQINKNSQKFVPRIFHSPVNKALMDYYYPRQIQSRKKQQSNMKSINVSKILQSSLLKQFNNSSQGSIFYIKNQLNDIVSNQSISFQSTTQKMDIGIQLRNIYQKFLNKRKETKRIKLQKRSLAHSIDKETQTVGFQYVPVIYNKDKQFLQHIIKQQKEKDIQKIKFQKKLQNKGGQTVRCRNSVEIHNNRYASATKISQNNNTVKVYESQPSSRYNSSATQLRRSQRTKSQTQDSQNITKALESQFNNQTDGRQTLKRYESQQKNVK